MYIKLVIIGNYSNLNCLDKGIFKNVRLIISPEGLIIRRTFYMPRLIMYNAEQFVIY